MTYNFYADEADRLQLLHFIFNETDLRIFDLYSEVWGSINFQLWLPAFKVPFVLKKLS